MGVKSEEIRAVREAHAARFEFDLQAIVADLRRREALSGHQVVLPAGQFTANAVTIPNEPPFRTPCRSRPLVSLIDSRQRDRRQHLANHRIRVQPIGFRFETQDNAMAQHVGG